MKQFCLFLLALFCFVRAGGAAQAAEEAPAPAFPMGFSLDGLKKLTEQISRTGLGLDAIPALFRPQFVSVSDASLSMDDNEVVFLVQYPDEGRIRIYPQRIMVWHEVVNDVLPDKFGRTDPVPGIAESAGNSYTISYSPLSGTVVAFSSLAGKYPSTFGVIGDLLNANSILYDRISGSSWSQLLGMCIDGPLRGKRLDRIQVLWATWGGVKTKYNEKAEVLSRSTGYKRPYGKDPYGSYQVKGTYYDDVRILSSISRLDNRLPPKKHILGIEQEMLFGAVQVDAVREAGILNFTMGLTPMVAIYDAELDAVRIFDRRLNGDDKQTLAFSIFEEKFVDDQTKSQWTAEGRCSYGKYREKQLLPVYSIDAMWFSWAAFHRNSLVFPPPSRTDGGASF